MAVQVESAEESPDSESEAVADDVEERAECDQCGRTYTGTRGKFPSAAQKLATHKTRSHSAGGAKRKGNAVTDVAVRIGEASKSVPKAPTAAEWRAALGTLLSGVSSIPAGIVADSDPVIPAMFPPSEREARTKELEERLSLSKADAEVVAAPVARIISASSWNARVGRKVISNADMVSAGAIVVSLVIEWRRYLSDRRQAVEALARRQAPPPAPDRGSPLAVVPTERT